MHCLLSQSGVHDSFSAVPVACATFNHTVHCLHRRQSFPFIWPMLLGTWSNEQTWTNHLESMAFKCFEVWSLLMQTNLLSCWTRGQMSNCLEKIHCTYNLKHLWPLSFMLGVKAFNGLKNFGTSSEHNCKRHSRRKIDDNQAKHSQRCQIGCCYSYCLQHYSPNKTVIRLYITPPSDLWSQQSQHIFWLPPINDQPDHDIPSPVRPWPSCPPAT